MAFSEATAVEPIGAHLYRSVLDDDWWVVRGPNGGYVAAIMLRAILSEVSDPSRPPRSLTLHYLAPPAPGPAEIEVTVERSGRSLASVSARMYQGGRPLVLALAALSSPWPRNRDFTDAVPPEVAPLGETVPRPPEALPPIAHRFEFQLGIGGPPFRAGDEALTGGWIRLVEPAAVDACVVAALTDAWFPAAFVRLDAPAALPTVDLTIHFREELPLAGAAPGDWSIGVFRSRHARDGFVEEDGEIWSPEGVLLAQSRQLALLI